MNCVAPGWVATEMSAAAVGDPELGAKIRAGIPVGRVASTAGDCGAGAVFVHAAGGVHLRRGAEREWRLGAGGMRSEVEEARMKMKQNFAGGGCDVDAWCWASRAAEPQAGDADRRRRCGEECSNRRAAALDCDGAGTGRPGMAEHEEPGAGGTHCRLLPRRSRYRARPSTDEFHQWPDHDRIELTKHRDVVEFYLGREGWEVTYRGKKPMDKEILDDYLRRRDHSIETVVKVWLKDPKHDSGLRGPAPGGAAPGRAGDADLGARTSPSRS